MRSFKKALLAALSFFLCLLLLTEIIVWPYYHRQLYYFEDAKVRRELAGGVDVLISGASQGFSGVEPAALDSELGVSSYNLGGSIMTMQGRETLLRKELKRNPVKTVFLELSYNALTRNRKGEGPEGDLYVMMRMDNLWERTKFFFDAFYEDEYLNVLSYTLRRGFDAWDSVRHGATSVVDASAKGFHPLDHTDFTMTSKEFASLHNSASVSTEASWGNKLKLQEIIRMCQEAGADVVFVATPMSDEMLARYDNFEVARQWLLYYAQEYGCKFYDFNLYRERDELLPDATAFYDLTHLSDEGAKAFSRALASVYRADRAGEDVSDLFYDSYTQLDEAMTQAYAAP